MASSTGAMNRVSNTSGGSAAAGGIAFQAALGAIACIHTLRGTPVQWTDGLTGVAPCRVSFETSGPGEDLSLELTDGSIVEIQARMGLRADGRFWSAIDALCEGVHREQCRFGILIVCPNSSIPVRRGYARALERIGDGRNDSVSQEQRTLANHLAGRDYDAGTVCARIRIRTVAALEDAGDAVAAARAELGHVCVDDRQVTAAWHALRQDSLLAMSKKGGRNLRSLSARLRECKIDIKDTGKDSPVSISHGLLRWTMSRTEHFEVLGISRPLPTDGAWLPLTAVVRDSYIHQAPSVEQALADYYALGEKSRTDEKGIDARTIGTFRKRCVVVGGPGSGKSLLLRVLAREFAKDSYVSVRVRLRDLATRMQETGCGVEEGLLQLGVDGSGVTREQLRAARLSDLVLLCDGLDECGERQFDIASGLKGISESHSSYRIVVTTRPIGYSTSELHDWRHYEIIPLAEADTAKHLETLCRCALEGGSAEETDEFLPRIRTYLKDGSASRILARSPLLLAFGAALFLNWRVPSKTKLELYQRIFRLIDNARPDRNTGPDLPAKAIRYSVLYELGWLTAVSPLRSADELESQCAKTMEKTFGVTYLQALAVVEASVRYWEEKGLIERLRHPGIDLIAFIHKTCGEFAAARHLSEMEADEERQAIETVLSNPDWDEILDFATGTRLATVLAELLVAKFEIVDCDESTLNRLFRVLVRPEACLSPAERSSFLERVFALARSEDRQKAYRVGICLTGHELRRMPEVEKIALALLAAPAEWSQLIGWAVLACHFPDSVNRGDLEDVLGQFVERSGSKDFFVLRESTLPFGLLSERGVFENFLLGALRVLLPDRNTEDQDRLIATVLESQPNPTFGFVTEFEVVLKSLGREDASRLPLRSNRLLGTMKFIVPDEFEVASAVLFTDVVPSAFFDNDAGPPPPTGLKFLAAFFELARIMDVPASDVFVWQSNDTRLAAVHALIRAAAYVYALPAERLSAEARQAIAVSESSRQNGKTIRNLDLFPKVDVANIDWSRARKCDIDMTLVEDLVHHPSQWVQHLATIFIDVRFQGVPRREICERLLGTGSGDALHWAAALTAAIPDGCEMLVQRLDGPNAAGLHHLFDRLKDRGWRMAPSHLAVLEKGLVERGVKTAVSAARWCESSATSADTWILDLLRAAGRYWLDNEEPYPERGGIVPDSPREALLRTQCRISPPPFGELVELAEDPRSDVRNAAIDGVVRLAGDSSAEKSRLVDSILAKRFSAKQCEKLLDGSISYCPEELSILSDLCTDQDPEYRLLAVRHVLTHRGMGPEKAFAAADSMRGDDDGNVRDAVYQFLERRNEEGRQ